MNLINCSYFLPLSVLLLAGISGCGISENIEIRETRKLSVHRTPPKLHATSRERFELALQSGTPGAPRQGEAQAEFHWETPEGWEELPPTEFRTANFRFGPKGEGECYLSVLPGGGGGPFANANRWRTQMKQEPYSEAEFAALPRRSVLGQEAIELEFDGAYQGMNMPAAKEGYRLVGLLFMYGGSGVYIKMVGPAALVEAERVNFDRFVESLHAATAGHVHGPAPQTASADVVSPPPAVPSGALPPDHPPIEPLPAGHPPIVAKAETAQDRPNDAPAGPSRASAQGYSWTAPAGWSKAADRPMRLVTYTLGEGGAIECYVSVLGGEAGGAAMNLNRWRGQMGAGPLSDEDLDALPKITVMGRDVPLLDVAGTYTGMGGEPKPNQRMLGVAWISPQGSVFIRMTGPDEAVATRKDEFVAFCESFERQ